MTAKDPFAHLANDPVEFEEPNPFATLSTERSVFTVVEAGIDPLDFDWACAAIAGILQLHEHPTDDLHGYTAYLPEVSSWLTARVIAAGSNTYAAPYPTVTPGTWTAAVPTQPQGTASAPAAPPPAKSKDPLAGLNIK